MAQETFDSTVATFDDINYDFEGNLLTGGGGGTPAPAPSTDASDFPTPEYVVKIADIAGNILEEVPHKNLQFTYSLNDAGSVSFALPLYHAKTNPYIMAVGARSVLVYRNGQLVWGGRLWGASSDAETQEMQFSGNGWFSILQRRVVKSLLNYNNVDQLDIAWNLIAHTQSQTNGNIGITRASTATSGKTRKVKYPAVEAKNIGEALVELAERANGFDFEITPDKQWVTYYPSRGQSIDYVFETGKNIRGYSIQYDALGIENEIIGFGAGEGGATKRSTKSSADSQALYGLLQGTRSWKGVTKQDTLDDHTQEQLRLSKYPMVRPEFSIIGSDPPWGAYGVGDVVRVRISDGYNQIDSPYRISTITVGQADTGYEAIGIFFDDQLGN